MIEFIYHALHGLSPLARGTLTAIWDGQSQSRFIPAGAGNTKPQPGDPPQATVYPRWRGEHVAKLDNENEATGLSPLARGTLVSPLVNVG